MSVIHLLKQRGLLVWKLSTTHTLYGNKTHLYQPTVDNQHIKM